MKVVLKITVLDRIMKDLDAAKRDHRAVDYIVVSNEEYDELRADRRAALMMMYPSMEYRSSSTIDAMTMETRDFELVDKSRASYTSNRPVIRTYSRESIYGAKLYVVPKEYCPR